MASHRQLSSTSVPTGSRVKAQVRHLHRSGIQDIVNGFVLCNALYAVAESKLLSDLDAQGFLEARQSARRHGYSAEQVLGLLSYLEDQKLFRRSRQRFQLTALGRSLLSSSSVARIKLYRGGYGPLYLDAGALLRGGEREWDWPQMASGFSGIAQSFFDDAALHLLRDTGGQRILGLGSGAVGVLIRLARQRRSCTLIEDPRAMPVARRLIEEAGAADRIRMVAKDPFSSATLAAHKADVLYSFGLEHERLTRGPADLGPRLRELARLLPGRRYLLGEIMVSRPGPYWWRHVLGGKGKPFDLETWQAALQRIRGISLQGVHRPDHEFRGAFFELRFG